MSLRMLLTVNFLRYIKCIKNEVHGFHTRNKSVKYPSLLINGKLIERVTQFNFLGLILQSNMSWNLHINYISLKISKAIGILYRLKTIYLEIVLQINE